MLPNFPRTAVELSAPFLFVVPWPFSDDLPNLAITYICSLRFSFGLRPVGQWVNPYRPLAGWAPRPFPRSGSLSFSPKGFTSSPEKPPTFTSHRPLKALHSKISVPPDTFKKKAPAEGPFLSIQYFVTLQHRIGFSRQFQHILGGSVDPEPFIHPTSDQPYNLSSRHQHKLTTLIR